MNMRLVLGCLTPISVGELSWVCRCVHWCRREESYVLQFSFHYRLQGCDLFPLFFLETEVFISAFHWSMHLIVNISELFQCKCSNLDRLELFWVPYPCLTSLWQYKPLQPACKRVHREFMPGMLCYSALHFVVLPDKMHVRKTLFRFLCN